MNDLFALVLFFGITFAAAGIGGFVTSRSVRTWYASLAKPSWTPPSWLFAPVWTVLYVAMAVAAWLVWVGRGDKDVAVALALFGTQLVLNTLWSVVFFGLRSPRGALAVIILLWVAIAAAIVAFAGVSLLAAALLVPYLAWVTFATALNGAIAARAGGRPAS